MALAGYFSHTGKDGRNSTDRLRDAQVEFATAAENIAEYPAHEDIAAEVIKGWMDSPAHRESLLDPSFRRMGVGVAATEDGYYLYVQLFAD